IRNPHLMPIARRQIAGKPFIVPETLWVPPSPYQSEGPLLSAAYQALGGVDALYWFCASSNATEWVPPAGGKWFLGSPSILGQFPAPALLFRRGDVQRAEPAVHERRPLADLWQRKPPMLLEGAGFDPNRDQTDTSESSMAGSLVSPLTYCIGPVLESFAEEDGEDEIVDLARHIDQAEGRVTSATDEIVLDWDDGLFTLDTPRSQAVAGWLADADSVTLSDVTITCTNEHATIVVTALDGQPLARAQQVLVQMGTPVHPKGWEVEEATFTEKKGKESHEGYRIVKYGGPPWMVEELQAQLRLANPGLSEAVVLDGNGYPVRTLPLQSTGDAVELELPSDALYVVLR
ncbi:MAG: hypothetical protein ACOCXA_08300, partial [Planctomycetota bacterium]